ncbi:Spherulation-specific family 4-domain-containing protein [Apodospora peruviana]|uniref:Spherulation-specific family 4-domain-containing protein n=1 Tax=Apodospora peruviana TaxID=516989 RepID=A0AAE0HWN0_9PEZI|nr:Spherulation-specific family 4-domain-containing protein [Apodospora peruviana]
MKSSLFTSLSGLTITVMARTEIMLPLYAAPGGTTTSAEWSATIDAIRANRDMHFYVVINPNNGPKNTSTPGNPGGCNVHDTTDPNFDPFIEHGCNRDYSTNLAKINQEPNAQTVGYIYTRYGDETLRSREEIEKDITEWALWDKAATWSFGVEANISIHGLWFDETGIDIGNRSEYEHLTSFARNEFATKGPQPRNQFSIIMNPGSNPTTEYEPFLFQMADAVVTRETCWTSTPNEDCAGTYTPYDYREMYQGLGNKTAGLPKDPALNSKAVVIVHQVVDPPTANNQTLYEQILGTVRLGVHSAWFTSGNWSQETRLPASVGFVSEMFSRANNETAGGGSK